MRPCLAKPPTQPLYFLRNKAAIPAKIYQFFSRPVGGGGGGRTPPLLQTTMQRTIIIYFTCYIFDMTNIILDLWVNLLGYLVWFEVFPQFLRALPQEIFRKNIRCWNVAACEFHYVRNFNKHNQRLVLDYKSTVLPLRLHTGIGYS